VTEKQTDREMERWTYEYSIYRASKASRGKKGNIVFVTISMISFFLC